MSKRDTADEIIQVTSLFLWNFKLDYRWNLMTMLYKKVWESSDSSNNLKILFAKWKLIWLIEFRATKQKLIENSFFEICFSNEF